MEMRDDSPPARKVADPASNSWALPLVLVAALALAVTLWVQFRHVPAEKAGVATTGWTPPADSESESVSLAIDFGNGARREFAALPWRDGMTVAKLLKLAAEFRPGISYTQQGEGELALLTSLDGVTNGTHACRPILVVRRERRAG
jgi:hypothetical protein